VEPPRRAGEMPFLGGDDEVLQLPQLHPVISISAESVLQLLLDR
jgi:hypothetical protein